MPWSNFEKSIRAINNFKYAESLKNYFIKYLNYIYNNINN